MNIQFTAKSYPTTSYTPFVVKFLSVSGSIVGPVSTNASYSDGLLNVELELDLTASATYTALIYQDTPNDNYTLSQGILDNQGNWTQVDPL
jgi:hypothetical protein